MAEVRERSVASRERCLVVGGAGFLGSHLVEDLLSRGYKVNVLDLKPADPRDGVTVYKGDICDLSQLLRAMEGCEVVISCVTPSPLLGYANKQLFDCVNIEGTHTLVEACKLKGVRRLVQTSSVFVVYNGVDLENGDETLPYSTRPLDNYIRTKAIQEQIVLNANCPELLTCAIRPNAIFGPGDPYSIPGLIEAGQAGNKFMVGTGYNRIDYVYVRNVTHGLILAAESLKPGSVSCGAAYNITNDSPILFWEFASRILTGLNLPVPTIHIPYRLLYYLSWLIVFLCWVISPVKKIVPPVTPIKMALSGTHAYFSTEKAKRELGYKVLYSVDEGISLSLEHFNTVTSE